MATADCLLNCFTPELVQYLLGVHATVTCAIASDCFRRMANHCVVNEKYWVSFVALGKDCVFNEALHMLERLDCKPALGIVAIMT